MFRSLLIANRGEIAVRIIKTARALGVRTVAVYSDADRDALHVREADVAVRLGPAPARDSYLNTDALLAAARTTGAEAIHPGYGFLAENAAFATACAEAGIVFVGPPPEAIRIMGSKDTARRYMLDAGVPVVPGADGDAVIDDPTGAAEAVGYPLLVKAAAGGGGKGMRVVNDAADLDAALAAVRREAMASFGDDTILFERWLENARHVEVQVFADTRGATVHLFDRDCSIQRRQQKVLEEAPAPHLSSALREGMAAAAVAAARAVDYVGAGTVEFLVAGDEFFFLEMNTRLQVEHPVTELITSEDLVAWQLQVAYGLPLPRTQIEIMPDGHAVEVRLYAEDPTSGYLPSIGQLSLLHLPIDLPGVRVDSGVREGDTISPHYDPLIAKVCAHGPDRETALERLARALADVRIHGVRTNLDLLRAILIDPAVRKGAVSTTWLEREAGALAEPETRAVTFPELAVAAVAVTLLRRAETSNQDAGDLFHDLGAFRLNAPVRERVTLALSDEVWRLHVAPFANDVFTVHGPADENLDVVARIDADRLDCEVEGIRGQRDMVLSSGLEPTLTLLDAEGARTWRLADVLDAALFRDEAVAGSLLAPMPGQIVSVQVAEGDQVEEGAVLLVLEAMKMEHSIRAPQAGIVSGLYFAVGDRVEEGVVLAALDSD